MERAFGSYVSGHLLERIRAQHGEAVLPPTSREASVFFADIRGFTSFSERLSPEALVSVLNRYFAHVVELVEAHQGYLNKFIGDAVVVVFNGPIDQPDHAERAVRCALALQEEVARLNRGGRLPRGRARWRSGVGVATGPMVCGNIGSQRQMEYTVIGDTVNLASRLTAPGQRRRGLGQRGDGPWPPGGRRPWSPLPALQVKGKEAPVLAYRVHALTRVRSAGPRRLTGFPASPSPLRDREGAPRRTAPRLRLGGGAPRLAGRSRDALAGARGSPRAPPAACARAARPGPALGHRRLCHSGR